MTFLIPNMMQEVAEKKNEPSIVIKPKSGWSLPDFKELKEYRDLFYFLVWRDIKVLYAQTILGMAWAVLLPTIQIIIFTIVFGKVARIPTEGIPYVLFATVAIIPWTYMSQAMSQSSMSLVQNQSILGKIYFPRLIFPITPVLSKLVDFSISVVLVLAVMIYYRVAPSINILFFPVLVIYMMAIAAGTGMSLSALAIRFRDVKHALPFVIRMLMYTAPIVYSAASIPEKYRLLYSFNPLVGVIEGYRSCLLGLPFKWEFILPGMVTTIVLLFVGMMYFQKMERTFVDVI